MNGACCNRIRSGMCAARRTLNRLPTGDEMERLAFVAGADLTRAGARAFHAFRF